MHHEQPTTDDQIEKLIEKDKKNIATLKEIEIISNGLASTLETLLEEHTTAPAARTEAEHEIEKERGMRIQKIINQIQGLLEETKTLVDSAQHIMSEYEVLKKK